MDRELFAHLEAKIDGFKSHIDAQFEGIGRRLDETQEQIRENRGLIEDTRDQVRKNRKAIRKNRKRSRKNRDEIRRAHVVVEDLCSKFQILAEGHTLLNGKIDRRFVKAEEGRREDREHLEALIKGSYVHLSRRDDEIEERVERLEAVS